MASVGDVAVGLAVGIANAVLQPVRPGPGPATQRWGLGFGEAVAGLPNLPGPARRIARHLNRFGSVVVGPDSIEFDGEDVGWSKVTEIRAHRLVGYLLSDAITKQVQRLPLWRFPGRTQVLDGLSQAALTGVALAADLRLDRGIFTLYVPAEVVYRGLVRGKDMTAGVPASLVLADPAVRNLVETTAAAHGVPVRMADDDALESAAARATAIRGALVRVTGILGIANEDQSG